MTMMQTAFRMVLNVAEMQCDKATKHQLFPIGGAIIDVFSSIIQTIACQHKNEWSGTRQQCRECSTGGALFIYVSVVFEQTFS